jgi:hypothetical protein
MVHSWVAGDMSAYEVPMAAADDVLDALAANLAQPKRARTDAGEVEQHDLDHQLEAARWVIAQRNASTAVSPFAMMRRAVITSPGASS